MQQQQEQKLSPMLSVMKRPINVSCPARLYRLIYLLNKFLFSLLRRIRREQSLSYVIDVIDTFQFGHAGVFHDVQHIAYHVDVFS